MAKRIIVVIALAILVYLLTYIDLTNMEMAKGTPLSGEDQLLALVARYSLALTLVFVWYGGE